MTPTFQQRTEELAAFVNEHGRYPSVSREPGKRLGVWLTYQRGQERGGRLSTDRTAALDSAAPDWRNPSSVAWNRQFEALAAFVAEHGKPKVRAKDPHGDENRRAVWLQNQRAEDRRSPIAPERRARLDALVPGWSQARHRDTSMDWEDFLEAVVAHRSQHGRWPSQTDRGTDGSRLGDWLAQQRYQKRNAERGTGLALSDARRAALDAVAPGWDVSDTANFLWQQRADELVNYIAAHGSAPRSGGDTMNLYQWMNNQRHSADPERARWVEEVAPKQVDRVFSGAQWQDRADEVAAFVSLNARMPRGSGTELRMYQWITKQRQDARENRARFTPARRAWLDQFLPGWDEGRR